ncbi:MAG: hypothetical protein RI885_854 [Actinomycetota bacterium]
MEEQGFEALVAAAAEVLRAVDPASLADDDLLMTASDIERLGRLVDAARVALAAEVGDRCRVEHGVERLSLRKGCRNANELIQRVTQASSRTAERRLRLGRETRRPITAAGPAPARFDIVANALATGSIGMDAAWAVVSVLTPTLPRASIAELAAAEEELVAEACGSGPSPLPASADDLALQASVWRALLDPDGIEPEEDRAMRRRGLRLGRSHEGLVPITGHLVAEVAAKLRRALDGAGAMAGPLFNGSTTTADDGSADQRPVDPRTGEQRRHDVFAALIDAASRSAELPTAGGSPPTVLVSVRLDDLVSGHGVGFLDGCADLLSINSVRQFACAGGIQKVLLSPSGRVVKLGSSERCFTAQQRRAISLRDGECVIPGCHVPAGWCEIHHVTPDRDLGPTHVDNGVLLCWSHHRTIDTAGWQIRMRGGTPQIKAPPWLDRDGRFHEVTASRVRLVDAASSRRSGGAAAGVDRPRARTG